MKAEHYDSSSYVVVGQLLKLSLLVNPLIEVKIEYLMGVIPQVFEQLLTVLFAKTKESYDSSRSCEGIKEKQWKAMDG